MSVETLDERIRNIRKLTKGGGLDRCHKMSELIESDYQGPDLSPLFSQLHPIE